MLRRSRRVTCVVCLCRWLGWCWLVCILLSVADAALIVLCLECIGSLGVLEAQGKSLLLSLIGRVVDSTPSPAAVTAGVWNQIDLRVDWRGEEKKDG